MGIYFKEMTKSKKLCNIIRAIEDHAHTLKVDKDIHQRIKKKQLNACPNEQQVLAKQV